MLIETWKPCIVDSGYLVSSHGRVFNVKTKKIVKAYLHKSRSSFYLRHNLGKKKIMTHVLTALHFHHNDSPETKTQVDHLDGNTLNPRSDNTEWVTAKENIRRQKSRLRINCNEILERLASPANLPT